MTAKVKHYNFSLFSYGEPDQLCLLGQGGHLDEQRAEPDAGRLLSPAEPGARRMRRVPPAPPQSRECAGQQTLCRECR